MGEEKTVHDRRFRDCRVMLGGARVDVRDSGHVRLGNRLGQYMRACQEERDSDRTVQKRSCTIALAVLSIYAVDFAINAGKCFRRMV